MRRLLVIVSALSLLLSVPLSLSAQVDSKLTKASEKIESYLKEKKPDWSRHQLQPIAGSDNVVVAQWTFNEHTVKVSLIGHKSDKEARETIQMLAGDAKVKVKRQPFGDEGYTWNARGAIAFRKGNLTIHVSASAPEMSEEEALCSEFASLVDDAINGQL